MKFDVLKFAKKEKFKSRKLNGCKTSLFLYIYIINLFYLLIYLTQRNERYPGRRSALRRKMDEFMLAWRGSAS